MRNFFNSLHFHEYFFMLLKNNIFLISLIASAMTDLCFNATLDFFRKYYGDGDISAKLTSAALFI